MIAEFGLAALWLAAALAALQLFAGALSLTQRGEGFGVIVRPAAAVQGLLALTALIALIVVFMRTDLSVKLVVETRIRPSRCSTRSPGPGETMKARCCCG